MMRLPSCAVYSGDCQLTSKSDRFLRCEIATSAFPHARGSVRNYGEGQLSAPRVVSQGDAAPSANAVKGLGIAIDRRLATDVLGQ